MLPFAETQNGTEKTEAAALDQAILAAASGSREAMEEIYRAACAHIYGFALSILKNPYDAQDVLHDCCVAAWQGAEEYRAQGKLLAWLLTITRNLCLQRLRQRRRTAELSMEDWERALADRSGLTAEDKSVLAACMERLSDEERQIVTLHALSGFRHREIAALLELPLPTVLSKYSRALKKLKEYLQ